MENITDENREQLAFAEGVDFAPAFEHIRKMANVTCEFEKPKFGIDEYTGNVYVGIESSDITEQTGAFAAAFRSCNIVCSNGSVSRDKATGELVMWLQFSIKYTHKDGGRNEIDITNARYFRAMWCMADMR